jgi:hypothetical protein
MEFGRGNAECGFKHCCRFRVITTIENKAEISIILYRSETNQIRNITKKGVLKWV